MASHTIYSAVVGSRAYGLDGPDSDTDRRGVFQTPTPLFWRLDKPPTHVEGPRPEQFSWEVERACTLALAANPTVLECLWSPVVEHITDAGRALLALRPALLSRRAARTYGDYARDQLAKLTATRARTGEVRWKQAMHMARLLQAGAHVLRTGEILVDVSARRDELLAIRRGELTWESFQSLAAHLEADLRAAESSTALPEAPDRSAVEHFLVSLRAASLTAPPDTPGRPAVEHLQMPPRAASPTPPPDTPDHPAVEHLQAPPRAASPTPPPETPDHPAIGHLQGPPRAASPTAPPDTPDHPAMGHLQVSPRAALLVTARSAATTPRLETPVTDSRDAADNADAAQSGGPAGPASANSAAGVPGWAGDIADAQPYPLAFATVSGAHLYGFASVDSDLDLRACHILPLTEVVGLHTGPDTVQAGGVRDGMELDIVSQELAKFVRLLLKPNGYVLEQLLSPLVVRTSPLHEELNALSPHCLTAGHAHHYLGFAAGQWQLFGRSGELKPALYTLRVLHTGIHLMRTGEIQADLRVLASLPYIPDLIEAKRAGEHRLLPAGLVDPSVLAADVARLTATLEQARDASKLPATPSAGPALDDLLIRTRLSATTAHA